MNLKGVVPGVIHVCNLAAAKSCYMRFVKLFGPQYLVERMQRYMATNIAIDRRPNKSPLKKVRLEFPPQNSVLQKDFRLLLDHLAAVFMAKRHNIVI